MYFKISNYDSMKTSHPFLGFLESELSILQFHF